MCPFLQKYPATQAERTNEL